MKNKATLLTVLLVALCVQLGFAQSRTISGVVKDAKSGETLPGVAVIEKGTVNGTSTNFEGKFDLKVSSENPILIFQALGMAKKEVAIGKEDFIIVNLKEDAEKLDEVVVTALGISKEKRSLGFSTATVESDDVTQGGDRSPLNALQGKVAGVNISSASGSPGSSSRVIIRGLQSVGQNNQPLFVIDGVPIFNNAATPDQGDEDVLNLGYDFGNGMNAINPEDIENISVLKGASATALYGSRAANGVILITTKKGRVGTGKKTFGISYSGNVSFSEVLILPTYQNTFGQGWDGLHLLDENGSWGPKYDGSQRVWGNTVNNSQLLKPYVALEDNVRDFFDRGVTYQNSLAFNGGDERSSYYVSFSNTNSDGIYPTDVDAYNRNTLAVRGSRKSGIFDFTGSVNFSNTKSSFVPTGQGPTVYNNIMQIPRDISIVDMADYNNQFYNLGNYFTGYGVINPYYTLNEFGSEFSGNKFFGGVETKAKIFKWADLSYRFGFDYGTDRYNIWEAQILPEAGTPNAGTSIVDSGSVRERLYTQRQLNHDVIFSTSRFKITDRFGLNAMAGFNLNERRFTDLDAQVNNIDIPGFYDLSNSSNNPVVEEDESLLRYGGVYAQTSLDFNNYLFLNLSARLDKSSTLPKDNNTYFYGGANLSFVLTDFLELNSKWFNYGKLRMGYGSTGNDAQPYVISSPFLKKEVDVPFRDFILPAGGVNGFTISKRIANNSLQPEITTEFEIGGEFRFISGRLTLDLTYYNRITDNLILAVDVAPESGGTSQWQNLGEISNKGIEALVSVDVLRGDDLGGFTWNFSVNYSNNKNTLERLNGDLESVSMGGLTTIGYFAIPGQPLGVFQGRTPRTSPDGKIIVDANGVPVASTEKTTYGNAQYDYIMGVRNTFGFKGFTLSGLLDIRQGGLMYSRTADINFFTGNGIKTTYNDRKPFVVPNSVQEIDNGDGTFTYVENTVVIDQQHMDDYHRADALERQNVIDKSYVKLREVTLSYNLPQKWIAKSPFASLSLSVFGRNLVVWRPVDNQFVDPESTTFGNANEAGFGEFSANPSVRTYGFGLKASF